MPNRDIEQFGHLKEQAQALINQAAAQLDISARGYMRPIKVARTIADLESSQAIGAAHIAEALQYRGQRYQLQLKTT